MSSAVSDENPIPPDQRYTKVALVGEFVDLVMSYGHTREWVEASKLPGIACELVPVEQADRWRAELSELRAKLRDVRELVLRIPADRHRTLSTLRALLDEHGSQP